MKGLTKIIKGFRPNNKRVELEERKLLELIQGMTNDPTTVKLISPTTQEYFLLDKSREVYVCIEHNQIKVANHEYCLAIPIRMGFGETLKVSINKKLEVDRQKLKKELFKNQIDLIDKIKTNYEERV